MTDIHDRLKDLAGIHGRDILLHKSLVAIMADEMIFKSYENHTYQQLFSQAVEMNLHSEICGCAGMTAEKAEKYAQKLYGLMSKSEARYVVDCFAYAAGMIAEVAQFRATDEQITQTVELTEDAVPYIAHGSDKCIGTMIPSAMVDSVHRQLNEIAEEEGSVAEYVVSEMQLKSQEDLETKISGEQIDGVALAIKQMSIGRGFIIGDMTGVGKGRQIAMLIKWATIQGCKPVVVTEKANLFNDLYRDLCDVGYGDLRPFILNASRDAKIVDSDGFTAFGLPPCDDLEEFKTTKRLPAGYDFLLLTYSQLNKESSVNWKCEAVLGAVRNSYLIMDECHNASGSDSNTGRFFREAVKEATGVCFSSATFAKNPSSMPIYALKTALGESHIASEDLIKIISNGGPILQEVMAKGLVDSGSMIRRQRDMSDAEKEIYISDDPLLTSQVREQYDTAVRLIHDINGYYKDYIEPVLRHQNPLAILEAKYPRLKRATLSSDKIPQIITNSFSVTMMPVVRKLLFVIKTQDAVNAVIKELKAGRKPIVQICKTMESSLSRLGTIGSELPSSNFLHTIVEQFEKVFNYRAVGYFKTGKSKKPTKKYEVSSTLGFDELEIFHGNKDAELAYQTLVNKIKNTKINLPLSPIDWFIQNVTSEGYTVGEMTQRKIKFEYSDINKGASGKGKIQRIKQPDKKGLANKFNNGQIDVLIGNSTMASGISLHSSEQFQDTRQRVVITWEMQERVDVQTQFDGRADRTGQISHCSFRILSSAIPAEQRFLMMNSSKQRSLNANVQANQKVDTPCVDILNMYGAQVAHEYLKDHPEKIHLFENALNIPLKHPANKLKFINEFMRSLCLVECDEQEAVLSDITARYENLISDLDAAGENDLHFNVMPLNATLLNRSVFAKGISRGGSAFGNDADLDHVEIDILNKPFSAEELTAKASELMTQEETVTKINETVAQRIKAVTLYYENLRKKALDQLAELKLTGQKIIPSRLALLEDRANNSEKLTEQIKKILLAKDSLLEIVQKFHQFQPVAIPIVFREEVILEDPKLVKNVPIGMFLGFRIVGKEIVPSCIKAVFAVNDSRRKIELPLTSANPFDLILKQTHVGVVWNQIKSLTAATWDNFISKKKRENAYIVTGNLILGIAKAKKMSENIRDRKRAEIVSSMCKGKLITYTDNKGRMRHGYLLPTFYSPKYLQTML